jgi:hypothetical protein
MAGKSLVGVYTDLKNHAAGDAAHDFNGARGNFNFKTFFDRGYHLIGTPGTPGELKHEYQLLNDFLKLSADTTEAACGRIFEGTFLQEGAENVFPRFAEDPIPYKVRAKKVCTTSDERNWLLTSRELYAFLNRNSPNELAFTIDTTSLSVAEGLTRGNGGEKLTAHYILSREGIVDGALKANKSLESREEDDVQIIKQHDNDPSIVAYPATDINRLATLHHTELFFSQYPIHIPPVKVINGVKATSIEFTNRIMTGQKDKFKSLKEDSNPYTVNKLSNLLQYFSKIITGARGISKPERDYHMCLQFKRAGDWLQVLACLSPERFTLPTTTRIRLITNDRLCLLYGLKMGVDVAFTMINKFQNGDTESWIITFYKDAEELEPSGAVVKPDVQLTPFEKLMGRLTTVINPEVNILEDVPGNYFECRDAYITKYNSIHEELQKKFMEELQKNTGAIQQMKTDIEIEKSIHNILKAAMRLALFKTKCPEIHNKNEENLFKFLSEYDGRVITEREISDIETILNKYIYQRQILVTAANVKRVAAHSGMESINQYFNAIYRETPASLKERYTMIDKLSFRTRLFHWDNFNENGTGIFTYLNGGLKDHEKIAIESYMKSISTFVSAINRDKYKTFLKLASFLQQTREATVPTMAEIPTEQIIRSMFNKPPEAGGAEGPEQPEPSNNFAINIVKLINGDGAITHEKEEAIATSATNEDGGSIIEISDFFAEQTILAARVRGMKGFRELLGINVMEGGGADQFNHNPLTTLCLTLWEINSTLVCDHPDIFLLYKLSRIIEHILTEHVKTMRHMSSIEEVYDYLHSLELFLLEGIDRELPNRSFNHFMAGIKEEYYGFTAVRNYKKYMRLSRKEIDEFLRLRPRNISINQLMKLNMNLLETALTYVGVIEKIALGGTNVRPTRSTNVGSSKLNNRTRKRLGMNNKSRNRKLVATIGGSRRKRR